MKPARNAAVKNSPTPKPVARYGSARACPVDKMHCCRRSSCTRGLPLMRPAYNLPFPAAYHSGDDAYAVASWVTNRIPGSNAQCRACNVGEKRNADERHGDDHVVDVAAVLRSLDAGGGEWEDFAHKLLLIGAIGGKLSEVWCATKHTYDVLLLAIELIVLTSRRQNDVVVERIASLVARLVPMYVDAVRRRRSGIDVAGAGNGSEEGGAEDDVGDDSRPVRRTATSRRAVLLQNRSAIRSRRTSRKDVDPMSSDDDSETPSQDTSDVCESSSGTPKRSMRTGIDHHGRVTKRPAGLLWS